MPTRPRHYRKKPLATFEHGTRIYAPTAGEARYRVVATDSTGSRLFHKLAAEDDARAKARELEATWPTPRPCAPPPSARAPSPPWPSTTSPTWAVARCAIGSVRSPCCADGSCLGWATSPSAHGRRP